MKFLPWSLHILRTNPLLAQNIFISNLPPNSKLIAFADIQIKMSSNLPEKLTSQFTNDRVGVTRIEGSCCLVVGMLFGIYYIDISEYIALLYPSPLKSNTIQMVQNINLMPQCKVFYITLHGGIKVSFKISCIRDFFSIITWCSVLLS